MIEIYLHDFSLSHEQKDNLLVLFQWDILEVQISYISDFRSAKVLREITDTLCRNFWIIPKWRTRIVLILDELHNNAIEYGSLQWERNIFFLKIEKIQGKGYSIIASVTDTWHWLKAKKAIQMEEIRKNHENEDFRKHTSIRGRWLFLIISHLVDALRFEDDVSGSGLRVIIEKQLSLNS